MIGPRSGSESGLWWTRDTSLIQAERLNGHYQADRVLALGGQRRLEVAVELVKAGRTRHGLFFAHLALEKLLKAHMCRTIGDLAPRIHALLRLAERTDLSVSEPQRLFLARFDQYQLEGRYPDMLPMAPDIETARSELRQAQEMFEWLIQQL